MRYIAISDSESEREFYDMLIACAHKAKESFYRSGPGFQRERQTNFFRDLLAAEESALERGVQITRIQTGAPVARVWASGYARLLEKHAPRLRMVVDFDSFLFNDVGLVDPFSHSPTVYLLIESREKTQTGIRTHPAVALFIENAVPLARVLGQEFLDRVQRLAALTPQDVRDLAETYIYFGWGVHMTARKMQRDVPDARKLGNAILRGWRRDIVAMLTGPADRETIEHTGQPDDAFDGVAYVLSWWGKARLDRTESRAYRSVPVNIEVNGQLLRAFTYLPLPPAEAGERKSPGSWIDLVIEGAIENRLVGLLDELRSAGVPIERFSTETL
jgi:hypothetical protein